MRPAGPGSTHECTIFPAWATLPPTFRVDGRQPVSTDFIAYLQELFADFGGVSARAMFGPAGSATPAGTYPSSGSCALV